MIEQWKKEITITEFGAVTKGCDMFVERLCGLIGMPDDTEVIDTVKSMGNVRPRIVADEQTIKNIKNKNAFNAQVYQKLKAYADDYQHKSVAVPSEFRNNLMFAREVLDRAFVLGFFYQNEGGNYAELLKPQLDEALKLYKTLNLNDSTHVLPYGELTVAFCVAYDWIYDALSTDEKTEIREAIKRLAKQSLGFYEPPMSANATQVNNWNAIFSGANIVAGLTMHGEDGDDMWARLLNKAIRSFTLPLSEFAPNGGFPEGAGYWEYQTQYIVYAMAALESSLGTDFNLSKMPGFEKTVLEPIYLHSNDFVTFDFSDSAEYQGVTAFLNWFGAKFNVPEAFSYSDTINPNGVDYQSWEGAHYDLMFMFWREDTDINLWKTLPKSYCFKGRQQVMSIRNSWERGRAYLAFKGGYNQLPHCNLDIGTFIYDWNGIRWFTELGGEDYDAGGFWDFQGGRWLYYTQRAEGHNTLVINPDTEADQYIYATSTVDAIDETTGLVDITEAYPTLEKGTRTFSLNDDIAVIKDELQLKESSKVYWFMHTKADITLLSSNEALLTKNGSSVKVEFELPDGATLSVMDAKPMILEYSDSDSRFDGIKKLCVSGQYEGNVVLITKIIPQE